MTRKITKQQRAVRKFNYQVERLAQTVRGTNKAMRNLRRDLMILVGAFNGKQPAWPQFNHEKETPERSRMHAMYGRRRNG